MLPSVKWGIAPTPFAVLSNPKPHSHLEASSGEVVCPKNGELRISKKILQVDPVEYVRRLNHGFQQHPPSIDLGEHSLLPAPDIQLGKTGPLTAIAPRSGRAIVDFSKSFRKVRRIQSFVTDCPSFLKTYS